MHGNRADGVVAQMLSHFQRDGFLTAVIAALFDMDRVIQRGQFPVLEADIHDGPDDLCDGSFVHSKLLLLEYFVWPQPLSASAPFTISINSLVMYACRVRL